MTNPLKIFLVDNNPNFIHYQALLLKEMGIDVLTCDKPDEALCHIRDFDPDLLILDRLLDIGGLDIITEVKKNFEYLPVLVLGPAEVTCDKKEAYALGCIDYLRRDIDAEVFMQRIKKYCHYGHITKQCAQISKRLDKSINKLSSPCAALKRGPSGTGK